MAGRLSSSLCDLKPYCTKNCGRRVLLKTSCAEARFKSSLLTSLSWFLWAGLHLLAYRLSWAFLKNKWNKVEKNELLYSFSSNFIISFDTFSTLMNSVNQSVSVLCVCDSHFVFLLCLSSLLSRPLHEPLWRGNWKHRWSSPWCSTSSRSSCLQSRISGPCTFSWHWGCQNNSKHFSV